MAKLTCAQAKQLDMVDYLKSIGHYPKRIHNNDYWYLSPLREEKTPSFKVDRKTNVWYDHGNGEGGNLIDFGILYHSCSVKELLGILDGHEPAKDFSFHQPHPQGLHGLPDKSEIFAGEKKKDDDSRIVVVAVRPLENEALLSYLRSRNIPIENTTKYCHEIDFTLYGKTHTAIGFKNDSGGYELRSEFFKGASSPKDITHIKSDTPGEAVSVLEGFTDFLSLLRLKNHHGQPMDFLVLNSLSFVNKSMDILKPYQEVLLFLDRNTAGMKATKLLKDNLPQARDQSPMYNNHEDLNDYLRRKPKINKPQQPEKQPLKRRRRKL